MKQLKILALICLCIIAIRTDADEAGDQQRILELLQQLQEQVTQQQVEIDLLKSRLGEQVATDAEGHIRLEDGRLNSDMQAASEPLRRAAGDDTTEYGVAAIKEVAGVNLSSKIDGLTIKGDVRFRYEAQERDTGTGDLTRDRIRTRFRLGGTWANLEESWEINAGLVTGDSSATSANDTWADGSVFETGDIRLDYVYARHSFDNIDLYFGQMKQPWAKQTSYILWDGDVRPTGVAADYKAEGFFSRLGWFDVMTFSDRAVDNADVNMVNGQVGYSTESSSGASFTLTSGLWYYNSQAWQATDSSGNTAWESAIDSFAAADPIKVDLNADTDTSDPGETGTVTFQKTPEWIIADIYGNLAFKTDNAKFYLHGHLAQNFEDDFVIVQSVPGAPGTTIRTDIGDEDTAWLFGGGVKVGSLKLGLDYAHIEATAVFPLVKDGDFGDTGGLTVVDVEGLRATIGYDLTKSMKLSASYLNLHEIKGKTRDGELLQLNVSYKF